MRTTRIIIPVSVAAALLIGGYTVTHIKKIDNGKVGVVYSTKGVKEDTLDQGWRFIGIFDKVKQFSIANEQLILSKDKREGSEEDESFKVTSSDDANIAISFQMSYRFNPDTVVETYKKFRSMDGESIVNKRVKTVLKSKISEVTTDYSLMDIYSGNRAEINKKITDYLNKEFQNEYGIEVIDASIIDVHPDKNLKKTIDARVTASQEKEKAKAEQEKMKVEKETELLQAQYDAKVKQEKARADAQASKVKAEATAESNKKIAESITPELVDYMEAQARQTHGWVTTQGAAAVVEQK